MLVLYRREKQAGMEDALEDHDQADLIEIDGAIEAPPGFENVPPPATPPGPQVIELPTEVSPSDHTDEQLIGAGWTQEQVDHAREIGQI
jgi:hypothetical protein